MEIVPELSRLSSDKEELKVLLKFVKLQKKISVKSKDQEKSKLLWIAQTVVSIHLGYTKVFELLNKRNFYKAWCELAKLEIEIHGLKKHFKEDNNQFRLLSIEYYVRGLQSLFPYTLFSSHESIYLERKCSICKKVVSIRKQCGHEVGEIYDGEMCGRIITKAQLLNISIVDNPVNKYAVVFISNGKNKGFKDSYKYYELEGFLKLINSPKQDWNLEIKEILLPHSHFTDMNTEEFCPCGSHETYGNCCLNKQGVKHIRYNVTYYK